MQPQGAHQQAADQRGLHVRDDAADHQPHDEQPGRRRACGALPAAGSTSSSSAGRLSSTRSARVASQRLDVLPGADHEQRVADAQLLVSRWPCRSADAAAPQPDHGQPVPRAEPGLDAPSCRPARESAATMTSAMPISCDRSVKYAVRERQRLEARTSAGAPRRRRPGANRSTSRMSPACSSIFAEGARSSLPVPPLRSMASDVGAGGAAQVEFVEGRARRAARRASRAAGSSRSARS